MSPCHKNAIFMVIGQWFINNVQIKLKKEALGRT
jgi:hypothetical protein